MRISTLLILTFLSLPLLAQNEYWQQKVDYEIRVTLDDKAHELNGNISIIYQNNSPQALDTIYMHLWPSAYSTQESAFARQKIHSGDLRFYDAPLEDYGGIDSLNFKVNDQEVKWHYTKEPDVAYLVLNEPLEPGNSLTIQTPFRVDIPSSFSRLGHSSHSYQITQWYPKPAVFDHRGWHPMPYLDLGEFYSEFGNFDVHITLPENYVVGATGKLQTEDEIRWLARKANESERLLKEKAEELEKNFKQDSFPPSAEKVKTLHYKAENVHDFAWFADKRYHVLKGITTLPSGRMIETWTMFTDLEASLWKHSIDFINTSLKHYSKLVGEYPYPQCTAVEGALSAGAGMEYPMITIIGESGSYSSLERVILHEVGHNWFYGILASNERVNPWMDEGINSYYEYRFYRNTDSDSVTPGEQKLKNLFGIQTFSQEAIANIGLWDLITTGRDLPATLKAPHYPMANYGIDVYHKPAIYFKHLEKYLGTESFDETMQAYFQKWKFKHVWPEDYSQIMDRETNEDLDWFFNSLLQKNIPVNHKLKVKSKGDNLRIGVTDKSGSRAPTHLAAIKDGNIVWEQWMYPSDSLTQIPFSKKEVDEIVADPNENTFDINRRNNFYRPNKLFKRSGLPIPHLLASVQQPRKKKFYFFPVFGWNNYDKSYFGMAFYNNLIPRNAFHFRFFPAYSFEQNDWTGMGTVEYNFYSSKEWLRRIRVGLTGQSFHYNAYEDLDFRYYKVQPSVTVFFDKIHNFSHLEHKIEYRYDYINEEQLHFQDGMINSPQKRQSQYALNILSYDIKNDFKLFPWSAHMQLEQEKSFVKLFASSEFNFRSRGLGGYIELRLFAGSFLYKSDNGLNVKSAPFTLSNRPGYLDYRYDHLFLGRSEQEGFFYREQMASDGGFKVRTDNFPFGTSDSWLTSMNLSIPIPKIPVRIFADMALLPDDGVPTVQAESGFTLRLGKDVFEVFFPVVMTNDLRQAFLSDTENYWQRITFQLNLTKLNPIKSLREVRFN